MTEADADERETHRTSADTLAIAADALFIGGGVIAAAGLAWLIVEIVSPSGNSSTDTAFVPIVGPHTLGLAAHGSWR